MTDTTKATNRATADSAKADSAKARAQASTQDGFEQVVKATSVGYEQALAAGQNTFEGAVKGYDEFTAFGKQAFDAWIAAGNSTAKGYEAINAEMLSFGKDRVEDTIAVTKALFGAKSVDQAVQMQSDFAKKAFDAYVAETSKLGELVNKTTLDEFAPVTARYSAAFERFLKTAAN